MSSVLKTAFKSGISDATSSVFARMRTKVQASDFKLDELIQGQSFVDPNNSNQFPPGFYNIVENIRGTVTPDKKMIQLQSGESIPLDPQELDLLLYGDPSTGTFPRLTEFYKKLGATPDMLDSPQFKTMVNDLEVNFKGTQAYKQFVDKQIAIKQGRVFEQKYEPTPEGLQRYIQDYPEQAARMFDELKKRNPEVQRALRADPKLSQSVDELTDAVKSKKISKTKWFLGVTGLAGLATWLYFYVEERRKRENGCRIVHRTEGAQGKVELLTCDDALNDASRTGDSDVPLVSTCATQNYPAQTMVACTTETFNPCLDDSKSRAPEAERNSFPLVPDLCDKYLYRKALGTKDTSSAAQKVNACSTTKEDGACSKEYCDASRFAALKNQPDLKLQCFNLTWGQALVKQMVEWGKDVFCTVFPFCGSDSPPGIGNWYKYVIGIIVALALGFVGFLLYRKFNRGGGGGEQKSLESMSFRERQRLLDRLGSQA